MIVLAGVILGLVWGYWLAAKRGGNRLDQAQYAAVFAIALGCLGLFVTIAVERFLV